MGLFGKTSGRHPREGGDPSFHQNMKKFIILIVFLITTTANAMSEIKTVVSILPLKYLVQRIGGSLVTVNTLIGQGQNPELYEPQPMQVAILANATIYYQIGMPFEQTWIKKIKKLNPSITIIDVRQGVKFIYNEGVLDPHIWTSPVVAKQIAKNIQDSLISIDASNKNFYTSNYVALISDLEELDQEIKAELATVKSTVFFVFHPAWGYFAEHYGLKQLSVEIEGKESGPKDLLEVIRDVQQQKLKILFIQPQFGSVQGKALAKTLHIAVDILDPLAGNYIDNLLSVSEKIVKWS
jgi:zinc transport system substrate-binding protein